MYLAQSYRLKNKLPTQQGIRLPTLEWLQRFNRRTLLVSTGLLLVGLISGVASTPPRRPTPLPGPIP